MSPDSSSVLVRINIGAFAKILLTRVWRAGVSDWEGGV